MEMLLLGAGASVDAGVPGSFEMSKRIAQDFRDRPEAVRYAPVISFAIGGLLFQRGIRGDDPFAGVDVEELFNAVQLLADRHTLEAAPFIGSWHAMVDEFDKRIAPSPRLDRLNRFIYEGITKEIIDALPNRAPTFAGTDIDKRIESVIVTTLEAATKGRKPHIPSHNTVGRAIGDFNTQFLNEWMGKLRSRRPRSDSSFDREFRQAVAGQQDQPGEGEIFSQTASQMIQALKRIVWIRDPSTVEYLAPLIRLTNRQGVLVVATLNYDNAIETLADTHKVLCDTGIEGWSKAGAFDFPDHGISLLKLHGSIDWALEDDQSDPNQPMPHSAIRRLSSQQISEEGFRPAVIFGQRNKLTAKGPFLDLLRAFQHALSSARTVTVVGYSFRDPHVNEYLSQWLNADPANRLRIVSPRFDSLRTEYAVQLRAHVPDRLEIISHSAGAGLLKLW